LFRSNVKEHPNCCSKPGRSGKCYYVCNFLKTNRCERWAQG